jgi:hypothetical protein
MPRTAVINPRRRRRRRNKTTAAPRRRRNPEEAVQNPRRRRRAKRRYYGGARRRRRRNPVGALAPRRSSAPRRAPRQKNGAIGLDDAIEILPAGTAGVWAARWAVAQAGEFEDGEPGFKHALAVWIAASFGADLIGSAFGQGKATIARIAALSWGGDMFMRQRFMKDSKWVKENISLKGVDDTTKRYARGSSYMGDGGGPFVDALGNRYVNTDQGWALAGDDGGQLVQDEHGNVFSLGGFQSSSPIGGFESSSPIGALGSRSGESSFGYVGR